MLPDTRDAGGYIYISVDSVILAAHRLAWLYVHGELPDREIDHANCDPSDNRLENLRLADRSQNNCNRRIQKNNTSGFKGVDWAKSKRKWRAVVKKNNRCHHLGYYSTAAEAAAAYNSAAKKLHGDFKRVNT